MSYIYKELTPTDLKNALRAGAVSWPGGYQQFFLTADGQAASFRGVLLNLRHELRAIKDQADDRIIGTATNWEQENLYCCWTAERIPASYELED